MSEEMSVAFCEVTPMKTCMLGWGGWSGSQEADRFALIPARGGADQNLGGGRRAGEKHAGSVPRSSQFTGHDK